MRKAKRGFGSDRIVGFALLGFTTIALCACGGGSSASAGTASPAGVTAGTVTPAPGGTGSGVTVPPPATGGPPTTSTNVTLAWEPPTQNSDGTVLTDLVGYKIHYGTASQNYTATLALDNAGLTRYVVDSLPAGTYYFAVAAYNSKGMESTLSDEVTASLN
ncbi:MAG: sericin-like [Gammaproteobacteria bacterium]|nr:sericin-like [Gammaproteobacteria bacterium]